MEIQSNGASIQYEFCDVSHSGKRKHRDAAINDVSSNSNSSCPIHVGLHLTSPITSLSSTIANECSKCDKAQSLTALLRSDLDKSKLLILDLTALLDNQHSEHKRAVQEHGSVVRELTAHTAELRQELSRSTQMLNEACATASTHARRIAELEEELIRQNQRHQLENQQQLEYFHQQEINYQQNLANSLAEKRAVAVADDSMWSVCGDSLQSCLKCALCSDILIDAGVLPCSHGFCRACLEGYWHGAMLQATSKGTNSSSSSSSSSYKVIRDATNRKQRGFCPVCNTVAGVGKGTGTGKFIISCLVSCSSLIVIAVCHHLLLNFVLLLMFTLACVY